MSNFTGKFYFLVYFSKIIQIYAKKKKKIKHDTKNVLKKIVIDTSLFY